MVNDNFTKIPNILLDRPDLFGITNRNQLYVLIYLLRHKSGYILSNKQIKNSLMMHNDTIKESVESLREIGLIDYKQTGKGKIYSFDGLKEMFKKIPKTEPEKRPKTDTIPKTEPENRPKTDNPKTDTRPKTEPDRPKTEPASDLKLNTYNTNNKTKEKTTSTREKLRKKVRNKIENFFNNMIDERVDEIIEDIDPSFYAFKSYTPKDKEIDDFIEKGSVESLDSFDEYLYDGIITESFVFNGQLIKPRLILFLSNSYRMSELIDFHFNREQEEIVLSEAKEHPLKKKRDEFFGNAPSFEEFISQQEESNEEENTYEKLPKEEAGFLHALHSYSRPDDDSTDELDSTEKEYEASETDIEELLQEL
jgi:hypothetical protein